VSPTPVSDQKIVYVYGLHNPAFTLSLHPPVRLPCGRVSCFPFLRSTKSPLSARPACRFCLCRLSICLAVGVAPLLYLCACTRSYCRFYSHVCVLRCIVVLPVFLVPSSLSLSVSLSLLPEYFPQIRLSRLWLISCLLFNYTQPSFADCRESPLLYMSSIRVASVYLLY